MGPKGPRDTMPSYKAFLRNILIIKTLFQNIFKDWVGNQYSGNQGRRNYKALSYDFRKITEIA